MEIPCMPHEQHAQKILHDDTCTLWTKLFFLRQTTHLLIRIITLVCGIGTGMALVHKMADWQTRYTREKMVIATPLLWCTTAQRSCCHPRTIGDGHTSRDTSLAVLKMDADKKKWWILRLRKLAKPLCSPKVHAPCSTHSKPQWNMQQINDAKN